METAELIPKHDHKNSSFKIVYLSRAQLYEYNRKCDLKILVQLH